MKKEIQFLLLILISISCATNPGQQPIPKMVPDHTPYIAGLIEASPDTTHHYPEIVVGYFTDIYTKGKDPDFPGVLREYTGIYSPTLKRQVVQTSILYGLTWEPETKAKVTIWGPLGAPEERKVIFTHEGNGIYGDEHYKLTRLGNGRYKLQVDLPDGRSYGNTTYIPEAVDFAVPDSISVSVNYRPYDDGTPAEESTEPYNIIFQNPENSFMRVVQFNSSLDRELLLLEPDEGFAYTDRSNYLRTGIGDNINLVENTQDTLIRHWAQDLDKSQDKIWMKNHYWLRFSFFSDGISKLYFPLLKFFSSKSKWVDTIYAPQADAAIQNDSTYLFDVSTIRKVGSDGEFLPKEESDAIGFFSGYYSRYKQTTLYPIRNFDLDSVLTANGQ